MKFVLAGYGSRGDVEPCAAIGLELQRRGHDIRMAVSPNMFGFVEAAGLAAVSYGPDSQGLLHDDDFVRDLATKMQNPLNLLPQVIEHANSVAAQKTSVLTALAEGSDLLLAGYNEQGIAANVADYHRIPLAALHFFPAEIWSSGGLYSSVSKTTEDAQRRALGLPETAESTPRPTDDLGVLEIQAYDELCLPGLADRWAEHAERRPFVGALTLESPTASDEETRSWIAAGTPPIYFGFGSTPITPFADTLTVISRACAELGERALICSGPNDVPHRPQADHLKIVAAVNHAAVFPACRAVVHHGGAGTTAAGMRAGVPTLILWLWLDQPTWAGAVSQLGVGVGRAFSASTGETLVADLRTVLAPEYVARAGEVATRLTKPGESLANAAELLEDAVRRGRLAP